MTFLLDEKKDYRRSLLSRAGYVVFVFVAILNVAYFCLTDVTLNWSAMLNFTCDALLYVSSVYVTFCAMAETARQNATETTLYKDSLAKCKTAISQAKPYRLQLSAYLTLYIAQNLEERRRDLLESVGLSLEEYEEKWKRMTRPEQKAAGLTHMQRCHIAQAKHLRALPLRRDTLLTCAEQSPQKQLMISPLRMRARRYGKALVPTALFALFSAQIVFAAEGQSDLRIVLVASLLRIGLLAFTALRGYMVGERTILCDTVGYLDAKSDFLDSFSTWAAKHQTSHA